MENMLCLWQDNNLLVNIMFLQVDNVIVNSLNESWKLFFSNTEDLRRAERTHMEMLKRLNSVT